MHSVVVSELNKHFHDGYYGVSGMAGIRVMAYLTHGFFRFRKQCTIEHVKNHHHNVVVNWYEHHQFTWKERYTDAMHISEEGKVCCINRFQEFSLGDRMCSGCITAIKKCHRTHSVQ